jgi:3D (Asp-Asp-Asp) domain-containing protein
MACDSANMGRTFEIEGIGTRRCTDTGGAIKGAGRFDIYVSDISEAYAFGVQNRQYRIVP